MDDYYHDSGSIRPWQWAVTVVVIIILIVLGYYLFRGCGDQCVAGSPQKEQTEEEYCKEAGEYTLKYLPVKCIKYYLNSDEKKIYLENVKE